MKVEFKGIVRNIEGVPLENSDNKLVLLTIGREEFDQDQIPLGEKRYPVKLWNPSPRQSEIKVGHDVHVIGKLRPSETEDGKIFLEINCVKLEKTENQTVE